MSFGRYDSASGGVKVVPVRCKTWRCPGCGPRRRAAYCGAIAAAAERHKMVRMLTLTLDMWRLGPSENPIRYIQACWAELRLSITRSFGAGMRFIRVIELRADGSHVHLHCLIDRYLPQRWLSRAWQRVGGGKIVDIRMVAPRRVAAYVAKYMAKALDGGQMYRLRRVTCSRGVQLLAKKKSETKWALAPVSCRMLAAAFGPESVKVSPDGEIGELIFIREAHYVAETFLRSAWWDKAGRDAFGWPCLVD